MDDFKSFKKNNNETGRTVGGLFLLVIGIYFLMNEFHFIPFWFSLRKLWPLVFVAIGLSFIMKSKQRNAWEDWKRQQSFTPPEKETPVDKPVADSAKEPEAAAKIDDRFTKRDT